MYYLYQYNPSKNDFSKIPCTLRKEGETYLQFHYPDHLPSSQMPVTRTFGIKKEEIGVVNAKSNDITNAEKYHVVLSKEDDNKAMEKFFSYIGRELQQIEDTRNQLISLVEREKLIDKKEYVFDIVLHVFNSGKFSWQRNHYTDYDVVNKYAIKSSTMKPLNEEELQEALNNIATDIWWSHPVDSYHKISVGLSKASDADYTIVLPFLPKEEIKAYTEIKETEEYDNR